MPFERDSSGHEYVEVPAPNDESIRFTLVPGDVAGYGEPSVRIQIHGKRLRMGPEIPLRVLPETVAAIVGLALQR